MKSLTSDKNSAPKKYGYCKFSTISGSARNHFPGEVPGNSRDVTKTGPKVGEDLIFKGYDVY